MYLSIEAHYVNSRRFFKAFAKGETPKGADAEVGAWQSIGLAVGNNIPSVVAEMRRAIQKFAYIQRVFPFLRF